MHMMPDTQVNAIVDKLLDMNPDPLPRFVLLKEFKRETPNSSEYKSLYDQVCHHRYVKAYEDAQNARGFWEPFHGYSEGTIRKLLSFGLDKEHICLQKASTYLEKYYKTRKIGANLKNRTTLYGIPTCLCPL